MSKKSQKENEFIFDSKARDENYSKRLEELVSERGYSLRDITRNWPAYVMRRDLPRFLSHYELFKLIVDLPGHIVELGIYRGASFFTWSNLLESFCPFDRQRLVFGFDSFEGLVDYSSSDGEMKESIQKSHGGFRATEKELTVLTDLHNSDNMIPGTKRCQIIPGNLMDTLPKFLAKNAGFKISLLHLDVDLYKPTLFALEQLYPLVVKGGVVCFDEYALLEWPGETLAVDEYLGRLPNPPLIRKHPFAQTPSGYLIK